MEVSHVSEHLIHQGEKLLLQTINNLGLGNSAAYGKYKG